MKRKTFQAVQILAMAGTTDWVTKKRDGILEARKMYFYRHRNTSAKFATTLQKMSGIIVTKHGDEWRAWPKVSYFWAQFVVMDEDAVVTAAEELVASWNGTWKEVLGETLTSHEPVR